MVPTDYRLESVCARLVERLESTRRSHGSDHRRAQEAFARVAREQVEAAVREYREVGLPDHPEVQERLLRREVLEAFLPRYTRLAVQMNQREERGLGALAEPVGRVLLGVVALVLLAFCWRFARLPAFWPILLGILALPLLPDLVQAVQQSLYRRRLERLVDDMARLQRLEGTWLRPDQLETETPPLRLVPPPEDGED